MRLALLALAACSSRVPISSCDQDLHGVWIAPHGERWMLLDNRTTLEMYPIFEDVPGPPGEVVVAPRVIDLVRGGGGTVRRRYMRRADECDAHAPAQLLACKGDTLELVLGEVAPPLTFAPCTWPAPPPAHVERWRRD